MIKMWLKPLNKTLDLTLKSNLGMIWVDGNVVAGPTKDGDPGRCPTWLNLITYFKYKGSQQLHPSPHASKVSD